MFALLATLTPLMIVFELLQLYFAERYIGIAQIRAGRHPLDFPPSNANQIAFAWLAGIAVLWIYMILLLTSDYTRLQGAIMLAISLFGTLSRRSLGFKWALVILTVEGAVRVGLMGNIVIGYFFGRY